MGHKKHHHKRWITVDTLDKIQERRDKKAAINTSRTRAEEVKAHAEYTEEWVEHLKKRLNRPAPLDPLNIEVTFTDLPINVGPLTIEEINMAIRQIKSGKARGPNRNTTGNCGIIN
ncbi:unnamed protein product [Schistosoma curassoni]|uniref:Reverse transcriptase domain-containing protein n=1 Tax=Schistosoma curassoni TaxID=6186 RepID=A0A183KSZ9_9TREM|nr:unnamed protein product [Schistosoma curassoni]